MNNYFNLARQELNVKIKIQPKFNFKKMFINVHLIRKQKKK